MKNNSTSSFGTNISFVCYRLYQLHPKTYWQEVRQFLGCPDILTPTTPNLHTVLALKSKLKLIMWRELYGKIVSSNAINGLQKKIWMLVKTIFLVQRNKLASNLVPYIHNFTLDSLKETVIPFDKLPLWYNQECYKLGRMLHNVFSWSSL